MPSYTYELPEQSILLSNIRQNLLKVGVEWGEMGAFMREGHVEYAPIRNNPMRSGYKFVYQQAKLNLTLYFPEKIFIDVKSEEVFTAEVNYTKIKFNKIASISFKIPKSYVSIN